MQWRSDIKCDLSVYVLFKPLYLWTVFLEALKVFVINSGVYLLFFADSSEDTLTKLAGVLANGLWFLWGPRMLVNC